MHPMGTHSILGRSEGGEWVFESAQEPACARAEEEEEEGTRNNYYTVYTCWLSLCCVQLAQAQCMCMRGRIIPEPVKQTRDLSTNSSQVYV